MSSSLRPATPFRWGLVASTALIVALLVGTFFWFVNTPTASPANPASVTVALPTLDQPAADTTPALVKPTTLEALGITKPTTYQIQWTAYYITPAQMAPRGKGRTVTYIDLQGKNHQVTLTEECYRQATIEAAAVGVDKNGVEHFAYQVKPGLWKELPQGCAGMGNKLNALVPLIHVAADQRKFPYGSMVYAPLAVGLKLGDTEPLDGYFWISDVGSGVTGYHFDLFVGNESTYKDFLSRDKKPTYPTQVFALPRPPKGMDPTMEDGLAAILRRQGLITDDTTPLEKYKILDALLLFQQKNPHIPPPEYGNPRAATTLWFLTQAALQASSGN